MPKIKLENNLRIGFLLAKEITRKYAKTFYFASHFLPEEKRNAAYAVYAFCRVSDESVDSLSHRASLENLKTLEEKLQLLYSDIQLNDAILSVLRMTVQRYSIPQEYFKELIRGMYMDLEKNRYADFSQLSLYCYRVAGVVGLIMLAIFNNSDMRAKDYAISLGIAMQLTNILRDIREDYARDRIYLPQAEMQHFRVTESDIAQGTNDRNFKELLKFQIKRARKYYANSADGIKMIQDRRVRFVIAAMKELYARILHEIEKNNYDVFAKRARVNILKKILITLKIFF